MAHVYLSDPIIWDAPEHETFAALGEAVEDYMAMQVPPSVDGPDLLTHEFDDQSYDCLMGECFGPCLI